MGLIADSCLFIAAERKRFDLVGWTSAQSEDCFIAAISLSELYRGMHRADTEIRREERRKFITIQLGRFAIIAFGEREAEIHAAIAADLDSRGQRIGAYDSLIAATALAHDWSVATLNISEFQRVPELKVIDASPWMVKKPS